MYYQILFFGIVGVVGLCVDMFFLYILKGFLGPYWARLVSFFIAVFVTWIFNRNITFNGRSSSFSLLEEFVAYLGLMIFGGLVNYIAYVVVLFNLENVGYGMYIGVVVGSVSGMFINFFTSKHMLFKKIRQARSNALMN